MNRCRLCAAPLRGSANVCDRRACRSRAALERAAAQRGARRAAIAGAARALLERAARRLHLRSLSIAVVPANTRRLATLPAHRRRAFRAHLLEQIGQAARTGHRRAAAEAVGLDAPPARVAAACATCRGHCCARGGDHAFVDFTTIRRYTARTGVGDSATIMRAFLRYLPALSYRGSCVYHTATGCSLPRVMRGDVCNRFYCGPLVEQWAALDRADVSATAVAAADAETMVRVAVVDELGTVRPIAVTRTRCSRGD